MHYNDLGILQFCSQKLQSSLLNRTGWIWVEEAEGGFFFWKIAYLFMQLFAYVLYSLPVILDNLTVVDLIMLHHILHRM